MPTQQQLAANRANAQNSTGPLTPNGKACTSQNALAHGAFARSPDERYHAFRAPILTDLNPKSAVERFLADRIADLMYRLERLAGLERAAFEREGNDQDGSVPPDPYDKADTGDTLEQLEKAEQRLNGMLNTTLRRLETLQAQRHKTIADPTELPTAPSAKLQNEPNPNSLPPSPCSVSSVSLYVQTTQRMFYSPSPCPQGEERSDEPCGHGGRPATDRVPASQDGRHRAGSGPPTCRFVRTVD